MWQMQATEEEASRPASKVVVLLLRPCETLFECVEKYVSRPWMVLVANHSS
jgi:hypothetical protein